MQEYFYAAARGILGIRTNVKNFKWSFGINMPIVPRGEYETCAVRLNLEVGETQIPSKGENLGKYHYFHGTPDAGWR